MGAILPFSVERLIFRPKEQATNVQTWRTNRFPDQKTSPLTSMDRLQRWYKLDRLRKARRFPVARTVLEDALEVSTATVKRIIRDMRNYGVPIKTSRDPHGYYYDHSVAFELPGVWFTPSEVTALITAHELLTSAERGRGLKLLYQAGADPILFG